ncbi:MAG: hypothetical protein NTU53_01340 [Planctomycetota bacterium]|nr:hypothetical protein [Planctomycetota bacterium]
MSAESPSQEISIDGSTVINEGTIEAINSGILTLNLNPNWTSTGTIRAIDSTLRFAGTIQLSRLVPYTRTGGDVQVTGTVVAGGVLLALDAFQGPWKLIGGTIDGGSIEPAANLPSLDISGTSQLIGVTINADLNVKPGSRLTLRGNWTNRATINVDRATLQLQDATTSIGAIKMANSTLDLYIPCTTAQIQLIEAASTNFNPYGTLDNTGRTLTSTSNSPWTLYGGKIKGGTVSAANGASFTIAPNTPTATAFENVTLDSDLTIPPSTTLALIGSLNVNNKTITLQGAPASSAVTSLGSTETTALTGDAEIVLGGTTGSIQIGGTDPSNTPLLLDQGIMVRSGSQGGTIGNDSRALVNKGIISARSAQGIINVKGGKITNDGTMEARDAGIVLIAKPGNLKNLANNTLSGGTWGAYNGEIRMSGAVINANAATIILSGSGSFPALQLSANRGSLTVTDGATYNATAAFLNSGTLTIGPRSNFSADSSFTQTTGTIGGAGSLSLFSSSATATIGGTQTWEDGALVVLAAGRLNLNSDAGSASAANLSLTTSKSTTAGFNTAQHLKSLTIGGLTTLAPGGDKLIYTRNLTIQSTGQLDLANNDLLI